MAETDRIDPLVVLLDLTRQLADEASLENALAAVTDAALGLVDADHASIRLLDDDGTTLLSGARSGKGADAAPLSFRPNQGVAGWVVQKGAVVRLDDTTEDPRFEERPEQGFSVRSMVAVPLWSGGRVIGTLSASHADAGHFDDRAELLTQLLANCAIPAIERSRLERLSVTDSHTRAFNRRYLVPRLEEEMARSGRNGAPLSLALMDLDHFKDVNDEHGHAAGDRVLREFADRVRTATRVQDGLVRWGGEEFVLVMPDTDAARALQVAERIREGLASDPIAVSEGVVVEQTVSIGVSTWDGAESAGALVERADRAMYAAKRAGRDRVSNIDGLR
jgi:diguanylate cyclase (GGDEF)-like protein